MERTIDSGFFLRSEISHRTMRAASWGLAFAVGARRTFSQMALLVAGLRDRQSPAFFA